MKSTIHASITDFELYSDVIEGLAKPQKTLPSKYFYDKRGSELFEKICDLDEYYLTRTELQIMEENIDIISGILGESIQLIELGSGSSLKTRLLLERLKNLHSYVPVDISAAFLDEITCNLKMEFPEIRMHPVAADYTKPFDLPETPAEIRRMAYFPGSTIGNFTKEKAGLFIEQIAGLVGSEGGLLIGFDLVKDTGVLKAAYDDSKGVTADFNKNILLRINKELGADFDIDQFSHKAIYNSEKSRIEMHLESLISQCVQISDQTFSFEKGETIHTENSHKYTVESFQKLTEPYFQSVSNWTDQDKKFCIQYLARKSSDFMPG